MDLEVASVGSKQDLVGAHAQAFERPAEPPQAERLVLWRKVASALPGTRILVEPEQRSRGRLRADRPRRRTPVPSRGQRPRTHGERKRRLHQRGDRVSPQCPAPGHLDRDAIDRLQLRGSAMPSSGRRTRRRGGARRQHQTQQHHRTTAHDADPRCSIHISPTSITGFGVPRRVLPITCPAARRATAGCRPPPPSTRRATSPLPPPAARPT